MSYDLSGKTVFITGASKGIGAAAAKRLSQLGANVVLAARTKKSLEALAAEIGGTALAVECDVSDHANVVQAMKTATVHFGSLDVLVNNAGVIDPIARLEDSDPNEWGKVVDINLKGVYFCMREAFHHMKEKGGTIINISSGAASGALEGWSHYCSTKAGVLSLTKCGHKEWSKQGINVVGLSPGTVATDMQVVIKSSGINPVSQLEWSDHIPPEWVGEAIAFLTSDAARQFDGGDFSLKTEEGRKLVGLI